MLTTENNFFVALNKMYSQKSQKTTHPALTQKVDEHIIVKDFCLVKILKYQAREGR
jgi:hypothetical protein